MPQAFSGRPFSERGIHARAGMAHTGGVYVHAVERNPRPGGDGPFKDRLWTAPGTGNPARTGLILP